MTARQFADKLARAALALCLAAFAAAPLAAQQAELDRAYTLLREERLEEAAAAFRLVLEKDPANRTANLELGYLLGRLGRWEESARHLGVVSEREPEHLRLRMDYGYALERAGALDRAEREFRAVAAEPGELQAQARAALEVVERKRAAEANRETAERLARRDAHGNRGYAYLREGQRGAAREEFERALALDPQNVPLLKQLGYLALEAGSVALAVERLEAARQLAPDDAALALQLGFLYDRLDREAEAEQAFQAAARASDPQVSRPAESALRVIRARQPALLWLDVFAGPLYSTRFSYGIAQFEAQLHWQPAANVPVSFYLGSRLTRDSRSRGGSLPAIFSDNTALAGVGFRVRPRRTNLSLYAEANLAFNLEPAPGRHATAEPDYRVVLAYYRRFDARLAGPLGAVLLGRARGERLFTDYDASLGYYSRYDDNVIAYLQLREGLRLADLGPSRLLGYAKTNLAKDSNRDFYNNVAELGAGLEFRPDGNANLSLRFEYLRGFYYGIAGRDRNPYAPQYNDFRVTLLYGHRFRF